MIFLGIYASRFAYLFFDGCLCCSHVLALMSAAARDMNVQGPPQGPAFSSLGIYLEEELLDHMIILFLIFWGTDALFSTGTVLFYVPLNSAHVFQFLYILTSTCYFQIFFFFDRGHPNGCEVVSHSGFDLHFPSDQCGCDTVICNTFSLCFSLASVYSPIPFAIFFLWSIRCLREYCLISTNLWIFQLVFIIEF